MLLRVTTMWYVQTLSKDVNSPSSCMPLIYHLFLQFVAFILDHLKISFSLTLPVSSPSFPFSFLQFPLYLPIKLNDILSFNIFVTTCSQMCNIEGPGSIDQQQQKKSQIVRSSATPIFNKNWVWFRLIRLSQNKMLHCFNNSFVPSLFFSSLLCSFFLSFLVS